MINLNTALWITLVVLSISTGIIQIYGCHKFYSIRHLLIIKKRFPNLIMTESLVTLYHSLIAIPFWSNTLLHPHISSLYIYRYIGWIIVVPSIYLIGHLEAVRLWLISYNLHYLHSSKNQKWKSHIDPSSADKNWYIHNKNKWGNKQYVLPRALAYYAFSSVAASVSYACLSRSIANIIDVSVFAPVLSVIIYLYYKCPKMHELNDNFFFHYELRVSVVVFSAAVMCYIIAQVMSIFRFQLTCDSITLYTGWWGFTIPSLFSTMWITRKILLLDLWNKGALMNVDMIGTHIDDKSDSERNEIPINTRLKAVLKNEEQFELFMDWMFREFSGECMLCFIEVSQFKEYIIQCININQSETVSNYTNLFYDEMPRIPILNHDTDDAMDAVKVARLLYRKYIENGAEFEVNVGYDLHDKYKDLDDTNWEIDNTQFVKVFDPLLTEMYAFIVLSFIRFVNCKK